MFNFSDLMAQFTGVPCPVREKSLSFSRSCFNLYDKSSNTAFILSFVVIFGIPIFVGKNSTQLLSRVPLVNGI